MQKYYLNDISKMFNIPESTLRYYDAKGVLMNMERDDNNYRYMTADNIETIKVIICLKQTGMELNQIKHYLNLVVQGDSTLEERQEMITKQYEKSLQQLKEIQDQVDYLQYKKELYKQLLEKKSN